MNGIMHKKWASLAVHNHIFSSILGQASVKHIYTHMYMSVWIYMNIHICVYVCVCNTHLYTNLKSTKHENISPLKFNKSLLYPHINYATPSLKPLPDKHTLSFSTIVYMSCPCRTGHKRGDYQHVSLDASQTVK